MDRDEVKRCDNSEIHLIWTLKRILKWHKFAKQRWVWSLKRRMSIPSGRQLLIIGRFAEYLVVSGALVVQTCGVIHGVIQLNIDIVIVESVWDFNTTSKEKLELFYIINLNARLTLARRERERLRWKDIRFAMPSAFFHFWRCYTNDKFAEHFILQVCHWLQSLPFPPNKADIMSSSRFAFLFLYQPVFAANKIHETRQLTFVV